MKSSAIILMGGKSIRLGGVNKGDIKIGGVRNFDRVYRTLEKSFEEIALSIAPNSRGVENKGSDFIEDYPSANGKGGAAFAILACMLWAEKRSLDYILTTPVDTPFLPENFTAKLSEKFMNSDRKRPIIAQSHDRIHNLHGIWPITCLPALKSLLLDKKIYKIQKIHEGLNAHFCPFEVGQYDPFFNINTPSDLIEARNIAARYLPD